MSAVVKSEMLYSICLERVVSKRHNHEAFNDGLER